MRAIIARVRESRRVVTRAAAGLAVASVLGACGPGATYPVIWRNDTPDDIEIVGCLHCGKDGYPIPAGGEWEVNMFWDTLVSVERGGTTIGCFRIGSGAVPNEPLTPLVLRVSNSRPCPSSDLRTATSSSTGS